MMLQCTVPAKNFKAVVWEDVLYKNQGLTEKMLHTPHIDLSFESNKVILTWDADIDKKDKYIYTDFVKRVCEYTAERKYAQRTEITHKITNEKRSMSQFMVRIGYGKPEYKTARSVLLKPLSGTVGYYHKKPKKFSQKEWLETEVLPAIKEYGLYIKPELLMCREKLTAALKLYKAEVQS